MSKTSTLTILILAVLTASVAVLAVHKYETRKATVTAAPVNWQALYGNERKQVNSLTTANGSLQAQVTQLSTQKAHFCSVLSSKKLADPLCS